MQTLNTDILALPIGKIYAQHTLANNGLFELADLITLRQIRVKVIFTVKNAC